MAGACRRLLPVDTRSRFPGQRPGKRLEEQKAFGQPANGLLQWGALVGGHIRVSPRAACSARLPRPRKG